MRLFEHPDFEQAVLQATEHFREQNLRPAIIEKDYYVTEALRVIAYTSGDKVIFKGGTSLVKGWNLIQRFSEDVDIFLDPTAFQPPLGKRGIDRELKKLSDAIARHPALSFDKNESKTIGGFGRNDRFSYTQRFGGPGEVANRVLVEAGAASGREPSEIVELRSYLSQFLNETGRSVGAEDEGSFPFRLLHFRRTFVEKMFAIHSKVELLKRTKQPLGSYARHYYDLFQLSRHPEVDTMLRSDEYAAIQTDYDRISKTHFPKSYFFPEGMSFSNSEALFPPSDLAAIISKEYETQCKMLCYGLFLPGPKYRHGSWNCGSCSKRFVDGAGRPKGDYDRMCVSRSEARWPARDLELALEPREDHASYIATWLKVLATDNRAVFTAAAHAQRAAEFINNRAAAAAQVITTCAA